jgi:chaperonin GroEL
MQFDRGWVRPEFSESGQDIVYENPVILVTDYVVSACKPLLPFLNAVVEAGRQLVVIAPDFEGEALPLFVQNHRQGRLKSVLVKAPGFGAQQAAILLDIATLTGAMLISKEQGLTFDSCFAEGDPLAWAGSAKTVRVTAKNTTILDGGGTEEAIDQRIEQIRAEIGRTGSEYDIDKLRERLGKLQGGICVIKVGASSEIEMKELKARMEDALYATRASIDEGIVAGGGTTLIQAARQIADAIPDDVTDNHEELAGFRLVLEACREPLRRIVSNAGENGPVWVARVGEAEDHVGLDATDMTLKNMIEAGM